MAEPILHEPQFCTGVEEMRCDAVLENVEMLFLQGKLGSRAVGFHEPIKGPAGNRIVTVAGEQDR